jgi:glucan phosphoethanolaminetransferase (alkaline phosphatase superfamily)
MLQRIQTLFLAIVSVAMIITGTTPIWSKTSTDGLQSATLTALKLVHKQGISSQITPVWYIALLAGVVALVAIFAIFQFRSRTTQAGLCALNSILMTVLVCLVLYFSINKGKALFEPSYTGEFQYGFWALIVAMLANALANRFIRRDEKFVRSQERMR